MDLTEKTISRERLFQGKVVGLRVDEARLPNGKNARREVVEHPGGVCIAALTDRDELLFVRQFRYPFMAELLEIPAGKLEPGEEPIACARRELKEETGAAAEKLTSFGKLYPTPGYCSEIIYIFKAEGLVFGVTRPDEDEFLELVKIPLAEAVRMVLSGKISDAKTQIAVLKLHALKTNG